MIGGQKQEAAGGAVAIQSGRDAIIVQGVDSDEMRRIIEDVVAAQLPIYARMAAEIATARLEEFKAGVLDRFAKDDKARNEAFKDPDFVYLLSRAQHAYARSGDPSIRDTLIDLIAERSKQEDRNRLALSLNEAVEKASVLTKNEFAELSLCYTLRYTRNIGVGSMQQFVTYLNKEVMPFLLDISEEHSSYAYLVAQSCVTISMGSIELMNIFKLHYAGLLGKGLAELKPNVPKIDELFRLWKGTPLQNLELTSVGMAIGHANAVRVTGFDADLSIWIK
jgi:hypothetical protein